MTDQYVVQTNEFGATNEMYRTDFRNDYVSEADAPSVGLNVQDKNGAARSVTSSADLNPTDMVSIHGVPMSVAFARSNGYGDMIDKEIAAKAVETAKAIEAKPVMPEATPDEIAVKAAIEDGLSSHEEFNAGSTIAGILNLHAGLPAEQTAELVADLVSGEIGEQDPVWQALQAKGVGKEALQHSVANATKLSTDEAIRHLGVSGYNELNDMSSKSSTVRNLVIKHGIARAQGKTNVPWSSVLDLARQHVSR